MSAFAANDFTSRQKLADALLRVVRLVRSGADVESVLLERTREAIRVPNARPAFTGDLQWRFRASPLETFTLTVRHRG